LLGLALAREDRNSCVKLDEDAAEGPHVNARGVGDANDDFGGAVKARLDVRVDALVREAARAEVNDLDTRLVRAL